MFDIPWNSLTKTSYVFNTVMSLNTAFFITTASRYCHVFFVLFSIHGRLQLSSASGFQSLQFRLLENKLGVLEVGLGVLFMAVHANTFSRHDYCPEKIGIVLKIRHKIKSVLPFCLILSCSEFQRSLQSFKTKASMPSLNYFFFLHLKKIMI